MGVGSLRRRRAWRAVTPSLIVILLPVLFLGESSPRAARAQTTTPPNIVLILTDDQRYDSLALMPNVRRHLIRRGMSLDQAIVSNPLCCPSRATILTGRYSHSTTVYRNSPPLGGWPLFQSSGAEASTIATALDDSGYRTGLIGKYMNRYRDAGAYVPPGWDRWLAFTGDNDGAYYDYTMVNDSLRFLGFGSRPRHYSTDVISRRAQGFITSTPADTPLFLLVAPFAPHEIAIPAPRHSEDLAGATVTMNPAVNEADVSDKPMYIQQEGIASLTRIRSTTIKQWETLLGVDEMVRSLVIRLRETGRLHDTLFIYTTDNGLSNREHRWFGKVVPYEQSNRVPMVIRYDGRIPPGTRSNALVSNVDLAPTIAEFSSATIAAEDGVSFAPLLMDDASSVRQAVLLEASPRKVDPPPYCGVRTPSFTFVRYATGEEELYDLNADPWQLQNVASSRPRKANELRDLTVALCQPTPPGFAW